ncbi:hypothetical protein R3W88_028676 [Solanum pinnatisectum]|uniref:Uncharacterized protein n=1 Tax=Solanum pinnatisectum TaxID=50273 RepID=A0AAV9K3L7_9SOLN|nr:hypothetical protein R3W88_028676 [Solanum pinnatisectum]
MTRNIFTARFVDYYFDESVYPTLRREHKQLEKEMDWNSLSLSHLDPRTNQCEQEVKKMIYLQNVANQLPDTFTNPPRVTKSYIPAANALVRVDVPVGQIVKANESKSRLKRGRPIDHTMEEIAQEELLDITNDKSTNKVQITENNENEEISISYISTRKKWNRNSIVVDNIFAYNVAVEIMQ